jgi:hypothetical protein
VAVPLRLENPATNAVLQRKSRAAGTVAKCPHCITSSQISPDLLQTTVTCFRFNKAKIEHLLKFTEAFIWEDMPATDADNGRPTMAGRIQIVQTAMKYVTIFMFVFHGVQSSVHMWKDHDMVFATWYPFDVSNSPVYEIINLTQVIS